MDDKKIKEISERIRYIKKEKNAIILAHNYQLPEIQDIADFTGDSLQLARKAVEINEATIVFCGVYFMAETAAILNPDKVVLIPDLDAGCPLADFAKASQVREWRERYPDHAFVTYINSNADVKAEVDICCTSSNAVKVVESLPQEKIVFLPDKNLGSYVAEHTDKHIVLWPGFCVVHETADREGILSAQKKHPQAKTLTHPECPKEIRDLSDVVCSTGQMFDAVKTNPSVSEFIVVTEWGMNHALKKRFPDRSFFEPDKRMQCQNMKKITIDKVLEVLITGKNRVVVDPVVAKKAKNSIDRMLAL